MSVRSKGSQLASQIILRFRGADKFEILPHVIKLLSDKDESVRKNAFSSLSAIVNFGFPPELDVKFLMSTLQLNLDSSNPRIRQLCLETISHLPQHGEDKIKAIEEAKLFSKINLMIL